MLTSSTVCDVPELDPWVYPYAQIAEHYRRRIRALSLKPGERLPSVAKIAEEWGVAHATAQRAVGLLRKTGWVVTEPSRGTYVAEPPPP